MKKGLIYFWAIAFALSLSFAFVSPASAFETKMISGAENLGDFAVNATKIELKMNAGDKKDEQIIVTNRMGKESKFKIEVEDFAASNVPGEVIKLYGKESGPYSLKNYVKPEVSEFTLKAGEQATVNVAVELPADAPAGGLYGSVLVSNVPTAEEKDSQKVAGQLGLASRIGVLFFVRINGPVQEKGSLLSFSTDSVFYSKEGEVKFNYSYRNEGNVYLSPKGKIDVVNMFGSEVESINVDPFYVLPKSERAMDSVWPGNKFMFGRYTAKIAIDSGYNSSLDTKEVSFWVLPVPVIVIIVLAIIAIIAVILIEKGKKGKKKKQKK